MQDARLAFIEQGGRSDIANPGGWITTVARYCQVRGDFAAARERYELALASGATDAPEVEHYLEMLDARRARVRAWYAGLPPERRKVVGAHRSSKEHKAAYMLANREKFNALRRARRARAAA